MSELKKTKAEILEKLDIKPEMELFGIQFTGPANSKGWAPCFNPYKPETNPSCGVNLGQGPERGYMVIFNAAQSPKVTVSFFDLAADFKAGMNGEFDRVLKYYAERTGVEIPSKNPLTEDLVNVYTNKLTDEHRSQLYQERRLSAQTLAKLQIGFCDYRKRFTMPVRDEKRELVGMRYHRTSPDQTPKTLNHKGYGKKRLWGLDRLAETEEGEAVAITEGEWDAALFEQETGLVTVSPTNGTGAFQKNWVPLFYGRNVVFVWDCDAPGREALNGTILPMFKEAVVTGKIESLKVVWLFDDTNKDRKDFVDYIVKAGGSAEKVQAIIENTLPYVFAAEDTTGNDENPEKKITIDSSLFFEGKAFRPSALVDYMRKTYDIIHDGGGFYVYNQTRGLWESVHDNVIAKNMKDAIGYKARNAYIKDGLKLLEYDVFENPDDFKPDRKLINLRNGLLDLSGGSFIEHDKSYGSKVQIPIDFDPKAKCPTWLEYIGSTFADDPEKALALQDFSGYCLYPELFIHKCLLLIGDGENGKSVYIIIICMIIGDENICALEPSQLSDKFLRGTLKDKLLNVSSEIQTRSQIDAEIFKKITAGDVLEADVKFKNSIRFRPIAKHIFSMNEIPEITDTSYGFQRRPIIMKFNQTFSGNKADKKLESKLSKELPGILNWCLIGLERVLNTQKIFESEQMKMDKADFMRFINPVKIFVEDECTLNDGYSIRKQELYERYVKYCKDSGLKSSSSIRFYKQLKSDFKQIIESRPNGSSRYFNGIAI